MGGECRRRGGQQDMIVVCIDDGADRNDGIAARTILDHDRLIPTLAQSIAQQAGAEVHAAAWSERHDEPDRPLRPRLRSCRNSQGRQQDEGETGPTDPQREPSRCEHGWLPLAFRIRYLDDVYVSTQACCQHVSWMQRAEERMIFSPLETAGVTGSASAR